MPRSLLAILTVLSAAALAFQTPKGFAFGPDGIAPASPYAIVSTPQNWFLAGHVGDASLQGSPSAVPAVLFQAWTALKTPDAAGITSTTAWSSTSGPFIASSWDLASRTGDTILTAGTIQDTLTLLTEGILTRNGLKPVSLPFDSIADTGFILRSGSGGGLGLGSWDNSGQLKRLEILRIPGMDGAQTLTYSLVRTPQGDITISGTFTLSATRPAALGPQRFVIPAGTHSFLASLNPASSSSWLRILAAIPRGLRTGHTCTSSGCMFASAEDLHPEDSLPYSPFEPLLIRLDPAGAEMARLHPLFPARGAFLASAAHEGGDILLYGEQGSDLAWQGIRLPYDSGKTIHPSGFPYCSFLMLADSLGTPKILRSLSGIGFVGDWKLLRAPGRGWLALGWDRKDMIGWSRLFLLDDSLNVLQRSDTLPPALGMSLDGDSGVLLTGRFSTGCARPAWLTGSGSSWAASLRFDTPRAPTSLPHVPMASRLRRQGSALLIEANRTSQVHVEFLTLQGQILLRRDLQANVALELPKGLCLVRLQTADASVVKPFMR